MQWWFDVRNVYRLGKIGWTERQTDEGGYNNTPPAKYGREGGGRGKNENDENFSAILEITQEALLIVVARVQTLHFNISFYLIKYTSI